MLKEKIITLIGMFTLVALYLWGHNSGAAGEIQRNSLLAITFFIYDFGLVAFLLVIAGGIGRFTVRTMDFERISIGERVAIEAMLGLGIIGLGVATVGLLGYFGGYLWAGVIAGGILCGRYALSWTNAMLGLIFSSGTPDTPWGRFVRSFTMVVLVGALLLALAPPFAWDSINYHLVVPQRYIAEGAIGQHLDNHFFGFPQNMEMLYGLLMLAGNDRAPAVLHWAIGCLGLITIYNFLCRYASPKAGAFAVLVMLASFNLWELFSWAYVDLTVMTLGAVAMVSILQWREAEKNKRDWLILTAILASLAAGVKYTSAPLLVGIYLIIIWRDPKNAVRNTLIYGGFGVLLMVPWLVKGTLLYENPLYPYIFDGPNWDSIRSANFSETGKGLIGKGLWGHIIALPFVATIFGQDNVTPYRFVSGVFLLTMPFVLLVGWGRLPEKAKAVARDLVPMALVVWAFWLVIASMSGIGEQTRLMLVGLPVVVVLGGLAYHSLENWVRRPVDMIFITQAIVIMSLFFTVMEHIEHFTETEVLAYHTSDRSQEAADAYLQRNVGLLYSAMQELETLPDGSNVLFLWEPKTYYCPAHVTCTGDLLFDNWARAIQLGATPDEVITRWRDTYDYVLLFDIDTENFVDGYSMWLDLHDFAYERNAIFPDYFYPEVTVIWDETMAYRLYEWTE